MKYQVDLNCDIGESFGAYKIGNDDALLSFVSSANIACGYHAGDHNIMNETVSLAAKRNVAIGAHPGFQDLQGFGRRLIDVQPNEVYHLMIYQLGALSGFVTIHGEKLRHVKPHGALYNLAATNRNIANAIAQSVFDFRRDLILVGLSGSVLIEEGRKIGLQVAEEVFADRTYQSDGTLTSRTKENALIHDVDEAVKQVIQMITTNTVTAVDGSIIPIKADTICVHGDGETAFSLLQTLKFHFLKHNIQIARLGEQT
ncbi:5-oxoprolinase subunit PxpA [Alkalihalobacterium bogoriense]|uniref:5-oxoprolinase subunit PxpA n=1 Tax=Alkalihalobacterium bogoriense TaxID=246272 RepID=UPI000479016B|nr:5-oxoprolinase subunit PxpA [Alkalihalobacterium bogoriense]